MRRRQGNGGSRRGSPLAGTAWIRWSGVGETALVVAAFVGLGLAWAEASAERAPRRGPPYPAAVVDEASEAPTTWLVDGFNVLHAGLLGGRDRSEWWTEPRRQELLERAGRFDDPRAELWIVFDGPRPETPARDGACARPQPVFAASADAWLLERVRAAAEPGRVAVVTSDRRVASRARQRGARVYSPREFLARCRP